MTAAGDVAVFVSEGSGNWRCASYAAAGHLGISLRSRDEKGRSAASTLSNNADATNDIDIAVGEAASDGATPFLMTLASSITKRLDAAWSVGTGNGGLDTGSIANAYRLAYPEVGYRSGGCPVLYIGHVSDYADEL